MEDQSSQQGEQAMVYLFQKGVSVDLYSHLESIISEKIVQVLILILYNLVFQRNIRRVC